MLGSLYIFYHLVFTAILCLPSFTWVETKAKIAEITYQLKWVASGKIGTKMCLDFLQFMLFLQNGYHLLLVP